MRPKTGDHDIEFEGEAGVGSWRKRTRSKSRWCSKGENAHIEEGRKVVEKMIKSLEDVGKLEGNPSTMGKRIICTMSPR